MATSMFSQPATNEDEECMFAMQLASASVVPMALKAAIELDVLEIIAKAGPGAQLSPSHIVSQLPTQNPDAPTMLDRILRLLASYSILTCSLSNDKDGRVERLYGLAPVCKFLVKNQDNVSIAPLVLMNHDKVLMESCGRNMIRNAATPEFEPYQSRVRTIKELGRPNIITFSGAAPYLLAAIINQYFQCPDPRQNKYYFKEAVLDGGIPFNKAYGMTAFEYHGTDPRFNKVFNRAMSDHSTLIMKKILDTYKGFEGVKELVDVGGGTGATLNLIVSKYPHVRGINFDLQHVIDDAPSYSGVEHAGGDMFVSVPSAEAIFMKWILHDWSDEHCMKLLKNCHKALPDNGKVIIVESVIPVAPETNVAANGVFHQDLIMLAHNPGGKERTHKELENLAKGAGFSGFRPLCCVYNAWVMEFYK